ncbi:MAG TPA: ATPase domain-containing protein [Burkholderiaceae bacterium]|jgi:circadian clock protein KaiC|nr:ATPase domain-containing protein [Burkholderiaceae bacterium]
MKPTKIATGIPGLDEILYGGLNAQCSYLLVGSAGTGKTVFSLQWLLDGRRRGERGLYITLAEPQEKIQQNVAGFGWSLDGIALVDLTLKQDDPQVDAYQVFPPSEVENIPVWSGIYRAVRDTSPTRVVIDSLTQVRYLSTDEYHFRKQLLSLVTFLDRSGCTSILAFEPTELEREASVALAVDGILRLRMQVSSNRMIGLRSIQVEKLRGSDFMSGLHPLRIAGNGVTVFPHRIETVGPTSPGGAQLGSGTPGLDELLAGGIEVGTTTLITGPAGVGKSTLSLQFAAEAASAGHLGVFFAFEESVESLLARSRAIGSDVSALIERGMLRLEHVNAMQLYPDEFLARIREVVEGGCRILVLDSLRGYTLAMEEFGTPVAHLHNLIAYLNSRGVTTILANEVEYITGDLRATELGVSHLADNIILLRYAEYDSRVVKVIGCLKKRLGNFQPELRELRIGADGIQVSDKLSHLTGILTGVPTFSGGQRHAV